MEESSVKTLREAQQTVQDFARDLGWKDDPDFHKFDHIHEELIEMSQHLRYKSVEESKKIIEDKKDIFVDGIGDTLFALCRLANQLGVDMEEAFNLVKGRIFSKYSKSTEHNKIHKDNP